LRESLQNDPKPLISQENYDLIFENIRIIQELNQKLLDALKLEREEDKKGKKTKSIGEIFLEFVSVFLN
jgi:molybdate-binding protein